MGRLAVQIATVLMGKNKPTYTPHHDVGDFVVVTNAEKLTMTTRKLDHKVAQTFSGHPGGRKTISYRELMETSPSGCSSWRCGGCFPRTSSADRCSRNSRSTRAPSTRTRPSSPRPSN